MLTGELAKSQPRDPVINIVTIHEKHLERVVNKQSVDLQCFVKFAKITTSIHHQGARNARAEMLESEKSEVSIGTNTNPSKC